MPVPILTDLDRDLLGALRFGCPPPPWSRGITDSLEYLAAHRLVVRRTASGRFTYRPTEAGLRVVEEWRRHIGREVGGGSIAPSEVAPAVAAFNRNEISTARKS